jgi:ribose 5-phosphate isomerase A
VTPADAGKRAAGRRGAALVEDGMVVGLGSGSTSACFVDALGARVADGLRVTAVASSEEIAARARGLGIPVVDHVVGSIDVTIDGADEIDPGLNLVKGLGGALLREKIVAGASLRFVVVATEDKLVGHLGRGPLPVEVLPFLWETTAARVEALGLVPALRAGDGTDPYRTDNGNVVLDCRVRRRRSPARLAAALDAVPGVVGHGLFLGMASLALIGHADGSVREVVAVV